MRQKTWALADQGAGTALVLGVVAAIMTLTVAMIGIGNRVVQQVRLNALADTAALAAADALRGLVAGYPCDVARQLAPVTNCEILGSDVRIELVLDGQKATARAGEPN